MDKKRWWICDACGKPVIRVGSKGIKLTMLQHRRACTITAGFYIGRRSDQ